MQVSFYCFDASRLFESFRLKCEASLVWFWCKIDRQRKRWEQSWEEEKEGSSQVSFLRTIDISPTLHLDIKNCTNVSLFCVPFFVEYKKLLKLKNKLHKKNIKMFNISWTGTGTSTIFVVCIGPTCKTCTGSRSLN